MESLRSSVRLLGAGTAFLLTLGVLAAPAPASADSGEAPDQVGTIGGPGRAEVYPSGLETTPDGGVVLADTGGDRVLKYDAAGELDWSHGTHGTGPNGVNNPRDIGVDSQGNVYVADTGNTSVVKLTSDGDFVARFDGPAGDRIASPIGITVVDDEVLVADAGAMAVRVLSPAGAQLRKITPQGDCAWAPVRDVTADSAGNLYLANYTRNNVLKLDADGDCLDSFGVRGSGPGQFRNPYGVAVAEDPELGELLYVADSNNNRVQLLTLDGDHVETLGRTGSYDEPGTFNELRRVAVAADGDVWGADLWGWRAERWNRTDGGWSYADRIGSRRPGTTSDALFNSPHGIDTDADGNVVVADRMHHRLATFTRQGELLDLCGGRGSGSLGFNWPADLAVDRATGEVWVADTHQNRLQVVTDGCGSSTPLGGAGTGPDRMKFPTGVAIRHSDRVAFVADTNNDRLVAWDVATRTPIGSAKLDLRRPFDVTVDPADGTLLVADRFHNRIVRVTSPDGSTFEVTDVYTGGFSKPSGVGADADGRIYVADTMNNRVVILDGADGSTTGVLDGFYEPQAVHAADGEVYVADTFHDVVARYAWDTAPEPPVDDTTDPQTAITTPEGNVTLDPPAQLSGTATDDVAVQEVQLAVKDRADNRWWNPATGSWGPFRRFSAELADPGTGSTGWSYELALTGGSGDYWMSARAVDTSGNADGSPAATRFSLTADAPERVDTEAPGTALTAPGNQASVTGPTVDLAGTAIDDVGVVGVELAVKDKADNRWWNPATESWGPFRRFVAEVAEPGATSTGWSYRLTPTGGSGRYWASARAVDAAGNVDGSPAPVNFDVVAGQRALDYVGDFAGEGAAHVTPVDVAVSPSHLYALDVARYRIVRIDRSTGQIDAHTGGARGRASGDLAAARAITRAPNGDLYVADTPNQRVSVFGPDLGFKFDFGTKGSGPGQFTQVYGVAIGADEVVHTIDGDGRMMRWALDGTYLGRFAAGTPLNQPRMAEVNPATGDLWVVNARDRQVVVIAADGTERFRFGSGGRGPGEFMGDPRGIAIDGAGERIYVSDEGNHRVQVFDGSGRFLDEVSAPEGGPAYLVDARGLEVTENGRLVVSDEWDFSVKEFDAADGSLLRKLYGDDAPVGGVNTPRGMDLDSSGRVFVSDWWNQRVQRWSADGSSALAFGFRGTVDEPGSINFAWDVAIQPGTDRVFVANRESHEIEVFTADGDFVTRWAHRGTAPGDLQFPQGLAFAPDGTLVVADSANGRVQRFAVNGAGTGTLVDVYGEPGNGGPGQFSMPTGIDVAADGTIWVADTDNNRIQRLDPVTGDWTAYAQPGGDPVSYRRPWGVTVEGDTVWVTDSGRGRIVQVDGTGKKLVSATGEELGAGPLAQPFDTLVLSNGNLLVSDAFNNRIIEVER